MGGNSAGAGVTSGYLPRVQTPGWLARGSSLGNARSICDYGLNRMDRLHIHLGRMINNRPACIRAGSEAVVAIDGNQCEHEGMIFRRSANGAILTEDFEGKAPRNYISHVYQLRDGKILYTHPEDG